MEFHLTKRALEKYEVDLSLFTYNGGLIFADLRSVREFVYKINQHTDLVNHPEKNIKSSQLNGMALMDEIFHYIFSLYQREILPQAMTKLLTSLQSEFGSNQIDQLLTLYVLQYPPLEILQNRLTVSEYLRNSTHGVPHREKTLENLVLLWVSTQNPAVEHFADLIWDPELLKHDLFGPMIEHINKSFSRMPRFGPENQTVIEMLLAPAKHVPNSITGQLEYIREHWGFLLGEFLYRLLTSLDLAREEEKLGFMGPGPVTIPVYDESELSSASGFGSCHLVDIEAFSADREWMPRLVLIAKNVFVWLDQLSKKYHRPITTLDQIPDSELEDLSRIGITGLWLIGLWQRSPASARIKQLCGNPEAVSSAYSLYSYRIADVLGGDEACEQLKEKASHYGIRLASDMVPNHMGIDSEWVNQHPEWFLSVDECPFPSYSFTGPDLSTDENILIQIEDHYYDRTDAAVVFRRVDKRNNQTKFIYHGNDGTSMPWNDTAQLDYLNPQVREMVIQTILQVARRFPIIRFDAAMTLAKKHIQRLWYPEPGSGGAIPSRSDHSLTKPDFERAIPNEFWREVVERIEAEVPDTLLLAEAFWLMEGYFVRTLGMHRVYNSAFMHMLRNEDNAGYRQLIKNTLDFEPEILKRYVNFMNNPDERTAVEQFGSGDKYFGICTLMATLPGLPMFGHGQMEGFTEKYGMEYKRALYEEQVNEELMNRHEFEIFPLLYRRELFAGVDKFNLYDFLTGSGEVNDNVFVITNQLNDQKALVIYNNNFQETQGKVINSVPQAAQRKIKNPCNIISSLGLSKNDTGFLRFHDLSTGQFFLRPVHDLINNGFEFHLNGYEHHVFVDFNLVHSDTFHDYESLYAQIGWNGVKDIDQALHDLRLSPVLHPLQAIINYDFLNGLFLLSRSSKNVSSSWLSETLDKNIAAYLQGVNYVANSSLITAELQHEILQLFLALITLPQLGQSYATPGTTKVEKVLSRLNSDPLQNEARWFTLAAWVVLSKIGKLTSNKNYVETSLMWMDEWKLDHKLAVTLHTLGISDFEIQRYVSVLRLATQFENWYKDKSKSTAQSVLQNWFAIPETQLFLKFNRFDNKLWYDHDAFQEFLLWMEIIPILQIQTKPTSNRIIVAETILDLDVLFKQIAMLDQKSSCQVEKLLEIKKPTN